MMRTDLTCSDGVNELHFFLACTCISAATAMTDTTHEYTLCTANGAGMTWLVWQARIEVLAVAPVLSTDYADGSYTD